MRWDGWCEKDKGMDITGSEADLRGRAPEVDRDMRLPGFL